MSAQPLQGLRIGVMSGGVWARRQDIENLTGATLVRIGLLSKPDCDGVAGWGHKPTSEAARAYAARRKLPYFAIEDGFYRSVAPSSSADQIGFVLDRSGIYYESAAPSDLESRIAGERDAAAERSARAAAALDFIRANRLSKYNHGPMLGPSDLGLSARPRVVVVDQVVDDASIAGAGATAESFAAMLAAARDENPGHEIVVKLHPVALRDPGRSYLARQARACGATLIDRNVNPWALFEDASRVYAVSSQLGFEALIAGAPVTCFGSPFYAHWGLTDDRQPSIARRGTGATLEQIAAPLLFDYSLYLDPWKRVPISFEQAAQALVFLRDVWLSNRPTVGLKISRWKRKAVNRFLAGPGGAPLYARTVGAATDLARSHGATITVWSAREPAALRDAAERNGIGIVRMEDGFLRSVGLGAAFNAPASLVLDRSGIFFDPSRGSDFETLANECRIDSATRARAAKLRQTIVQAQITKYNVDRRQTVQFDNSKTIVLVPGQVIDDASVRLGAPGIVSNLDLLRRVRERHPGATILYKPHPDVEAGLRRGRLKPHDALRYADHIVADTSMAALLACCDRLETLTSLSGFEAMLRGIPVATHGAPFYSGWGLCEALVPTPRRQRVLDIDELVAIALILYPRYVDPVSGLPCTPELIVERLAARRDAPRTAFDNTVAALRRCMVWSAHNITGPVVEKFRRAE